MSVAMFPKSLAVSALTLLGLAFSTLLLGWFPIQDVFFILFVVTFLFSSLISWLPSLAFLLVFSPLRTLIFTESSLQLPVEIGQFTFGVFFLFSLYHAWSGRYRLPIINIVPLLPLGTFLFVAGISTLLSISFSVAFTEWIKWVSVLVLSYWVSVLGGRGQWQNIIAVLVLSALANACVGIYIFFGGSGADHLLISDGLFRAFGTFGQPNPFGGFMGLILPISTMMSMYYLWAWAKERQHRFIHTLWLGFFSLSSILIGSALIMSWSRGAWIATLLSFLAIAFALPRKFITSMTLLVASVLIFGGVWMSGLVPNSIQNRIISSTSEYFTLDDVRGVDITPQNYAVVERLAHWQAALNMATAYPILGVGFGNYEVAYPSFQLINWNEPLGHAHNYYLNVLAEVGILGLSAYLFFLFSQFYLLWKIRQHPSLDIRVLAIAMIGSWVYLSAHSLLDNLYVNNLFIHIGVILGVSITLYRQTFHVIILE